MFTFVSCVFVFITFFSFIVKHEQQFLAILRQRVPDASIVEVSFAIMLVVFLLISLTIWYPRIGLALALMAIQEQL